MKVFAVNPGSTSTKVALIEHGIVLFASNITHSVKELEPFSGISEQLPYRMQTIYQALEEKHISLEDTGAFVGRGGGLIACESGVYPIDELILNHAARGANGIMHPAMLGPQIAHQLAKMYGKPAFVVNPPDVDEIQDVARLTGIKDVYRTVHLHALNLKETAIRHAATMGKAYEQCRFVVCHIGGGISISAHKNGKMIDGYDTAGGEGPMAPTRCGSLSVFELLHYAERADKINLKDLCSKAGGFVSWLGTANAIEVTKRAEAGDKQAALIWDAMIYQIGKCIGAMALVLHGKVDGILLGGGMVHSKDLVKKITEACNWIAPVSAYPGEFEMEAMAAGAVRVLTGMEALKQYTGKPVWTGFNF